MTDKTTEPVADLVGPDGQPIGGAADLGLKVEALKIAVDELAFLREELLVLLRAITRREGGEIFIPLADVRECCQPGKVPIKIYAVPGGVLIRTVLEGEAGPEDETPEEEDASV